MTTQRPEDVYDYMPAEPGYSPVVRAFKVSDFEDPVQIGKGKYVGWGRQRGLCCTQGAHARRTTHRDSIIYAATCYKLGGKVVALKVYERSKLSSSKMRAIRREISIMNYVTQKKYVLGVDLCLRGSWVGDVLPSVNRCDDDSDAGTHPHNNTSGSHGPSSFMASCVRMITFVS